MSKDVIRGGMTVWGKPLVCYSIAPGIVEGHWNLDFKPQPHVLREHCILKLPGMNIGFIFIFRLVVGRYFMVAQRDSQRLVVFLSSVYGVRDNKVYTYSIYSLGIVLDRYLSEIHV